MVIWEGGGGETSYDSQRRHTQGYAGIRVMRGDAVTAAAAPRECQPIKSAAYANRRTPRAMRPSTASAPKRGARSPNDGRPRRPDEHRYGSRDPCAADPSTRGRLRQAGRTHFVTSQSHSYPTTESSLAMKPTVLSHLTLRRTSVDIQEREKRERVRRASSAPPTYRTCREHARVSVQRDDVCHVR